MIATAVNGSPAKIISMPDVLEAFRLFVPDGGVAEVRCLDATTRTDSWRPATWSGYFNNAESLTQALTQLTAAKGIYFTLNQLDESILARAANRLRKSGKGDATGDKHVVRRIWLLIDLDAVRISGISATDEEVAQSILRSQEIDLYLHDQGWPDPVVCDSGNGRHLYYRIDLPPDDGGLVERCLAALSRRFSDTTISIDTSVFNPSRITKLFGTLVCKGDSTPDRPHRFAQVVSVPDTLRVVSREQLDELAGPPPSGATHAALTTQKHSGMAFDVAAFIARNRFDVTEPGPWQGGTKWEFNTSPMCDHGGDGPFILQHSSGAISAGCHHNSCKTAWGWRELRAKFEPKPEYRQQAAEVARQTNPGGENPFRQAVAYQRITARELAGGDYEVEYLIDGMLVKGQPLLIVGQQKTLKTSLGILDAAISLAAGGFFLGKFRVNRPCRVGVMSGESGLGTIQETCKRICVSARLWLDELDNLIFSPDLPKFGDPAHLEALEQFIVRDRLEVLFIDPAYLAMPGADAGNLMIQGELLRNVSEICQRNGVTLALCHHTKKSTGRDPFDVPELSDIAWSGFPEFARQWWLLGRRERYEPGTGDHKLWLSVGGSAGHSALWAVDVAEGQRTDPCGRRWDVSVKAPGEARVETVTDREEFQTQMREERAGRRLLADKCAVLAAMTKLGRPETAKTIRGLAHLSGERSNFAFEALLAEGSIEAAEVIKPNRTKPYEGLKLKDSDIPL